MRIFKGLTLNHLDPDDPGFIRSLQANFNELQLYLEAVNRELSVNQQGSTTSSGAANTEPYVVASATAGLSAERVLTGSSNIGVSDGGPGAAITVSVTGQIPIANGGTGAATAAAARTNLGIDTISVNGTDATNADFDDATPAAPSSGINVKWQKDALTPNNISAYATTASPTSMTFGSTASEGSATSLVRTDARLPIFDGSSPAAVFPGGTDSGSSGKASRSDHNHDVVCADPPAIQQGDSASDGIGASVLRGDATILSKSFSHWLCSVANKGLVTKDTQGSPRYWAIYAEKGPTTPVSGDCTIKIDSAGNITASRAGGAAGDITIVIKDLGTTIPF